MHNAIILQGILQMVHMNHNRGRNKNREKETKILFSSWTWRRPMIGMHFDFIPLR